MNKKGTIITTLFALLLANIVMATSGNTAGTQIISAVCEIYNVIKVALPALIFVMIVLAAAIYAGGQIMSAEMRSRASVWANSLIIGAVMGLLIWLIVPAVLQYLLPNQENLSTACV